MVKKRDGGLRADAERNRKRLLLMAERIFAEEGVGVPVDAIAKRAGMGVGTVYRHFPTKQSLFEAIVVARIMHMTERARELADARDPGAAFFEFLGTMVEHGMKKKDFIDALRAGGVDVRAAATAAKAHLTEAWQLLLARAQMAGAVRDDIGLREVGALVMGAYASLEQIGADRECRARVFAVLCDGLRPRRRRKAG
ncbi:MAG TPA: helix-turn-helix domain-containing protein [Labilithrix sp.]|jgi:AcrR family transcriptional regulator